MVGPYDEWAIAYGYTPYPGKPAQSETDALAAIARRAPEPDLAYGTDEDAFAGLDPLINVFDLSNDLLTHAPQQLETARELWKRLDQRYPGTGKSFSDVRMIFNDLFDYYFQYAIVLTRYIGGQSFNRYQAGDAAGRLPFEPISTEKQHQALALLTNYVFDADAFQFSPTFINKLAPSRWNHWGETTLVAPLDYPIYDRILLLQTAVLDDLLDYDRLRRLRDAELKANPGQTLTLPELFDVLQNTIWREILQLDATGKLQISSLRRGLQREYLSRMTQMVLRTATVPDDARTLAWYNLRSSTVHWTRL
ncbi:MAG: hypothetical protein HC866_10665 [Leptolyngbyaceae cyanobacterium RU_5_1]|nr:hypothetical protein [Leptolyngbyaceae cyanobacterium RU_5_1]